MDSGEDEMGSMGMWANRERRVYYRERNYQGQGLFLWLCCFHVPALDVLFSHWLFSWSTPGALKRTIVGVLPYENTWASLMALDCLQPGFEVGQQGGLPDSIVRRRWTVQFNWPSVEGLPSPLSSTWHRFSASLVQTFSLLLSPFLVILLSGSSSALAHTLGSLSGLYPLHLCTISLSLSQSSSAGIE